MNKNTLIHFALLLFCCFGMQHATRAQTNLVINGGFETPSVPIDSWVGFAAPMNFGGWTVEFGAVDVTGTNFFQSASGTQSLDLNHYDSGGVYQDIATVSNAEYRLTFAFGANTALPTDAPALRRMELDWNTNAVSVLEYDVSGQLSGEVQWRSVSFKVIGTGNDRLHFRSLTPGNAGPAIDDVSLMASTNPIPTVDGLTIQLAAEVCWPTVAGQNYQVQWATEPDSTVWNYLGRPQTGDGNTNCITDPIPPNPKRFYRVVKSE